MGLTLLKPPALPAPLFFPIGFHRDIANLDNSDDRIEKHFERVNAAVSYIKIKYIVKKHFSRGAQLLEEQYVDLN